MKKFLQVLLLALLAGVLIGCSNNDSADEGAPDENTTNEESASEDTDGEDSAYPLTITDAIDNEVTLEEEPERIVSLMPSNTEITFALGQGDKVVGVSDNDTYPEEVLDIDKVGGMEFNVEVIISLDPDVVLAHESLVASSQEALDQLEGADIEVFTVADATDVDTTYETIDNIGQVVGAEEEAEQLVTDMQADFAELEEITSEVAEEDRQSVFFEISPSPEIYTAGQNTFLDELLQIIHADNAAGDQEGWVEMDPEAIIELNPEVIISTYGSYVEDPIGEVTSRDGFDTVDAVANERIYDVDSDTVSRPGPRLVDGAKEIAEAVYPELFDEE
ncbi:ABC transporter substrate-binding protein [Oceanobacillus sojae]|uniref:ABC transporter substrate-binding protein n=1 Tax=Oceanobacillus sojae TaxID=582851 RepID=UPI0009888257|nr:ABC transporter substrate-binding protein [Oceanobacillus sojae]MCT1901212.1 ABC transporter substrate-binding protein [Oceanobacillus sojae]